MRGAVPTRVVLYSHLSGVAKPVAEFRWDPATGVSLDLLVPDEGGLAQRYYERGVPFDAEQRVVSPQDGENFMRVLLEPRNMTYFHFADESG